MKKKAKIIAQSGTAIAMPEKPSGDNIQLVKKVNSKTNGNGKANGNGKTNVIINIPMGMVNIRMALLPRWNFPVNWIHGNF